MSLGASRHLGKISERLMMPAWVAWETGRKGGYDLLPVPPKPKGGRPRPPTTLA
jgi:hypothetical protein